MVQVINDPTRGSILGRVGAGIGRGLSEQLPQEIERGRLSAGLKQFEQESANLTPMQQLARLSAIPGITPQMIQSFGELGKQQATFGNFSNRQRREAREIPTEATGQGATASIRNVPFQATQGKGSQINQLDQAANQEVGAPQVNLMNPLREEALPAIPWTAERRYDEIDYLHNQFPNKSLPEIEQMATENEQRELSQPAAQRSRDKYLQEQQDLLDEKFTGYLSKNLEKEPGKETYKDVSGEMLNNAKRIMERELRENPKATADDIAFNMAKKLGNLARTKTQFKKLAGTTGVSNILHKDATLDKLKQYQKIFKETGNLREYQNDLVTEFHLTPHGAASIAYPLEKGVQEQIKRHKTSSLFNAPENSRKAAIDVYKYLSSNDSLLSIARALQNKDPYFDQREFFSQLAEDQDDLRLNQRQRDEIAEGANTRYTRSWGEIFVLPLP